MVKTFLFMIEMMNYAIFNDLMFYNVLESLTLEFNIGFLLGFSFIIQISSGFFLTCFYIADSDVAYDSIQFFTRNIVSCWIFRFIHVNGATILFLLFYLHIFKGLSNLSFKLSRELV
jgi:quinol-cytochrome oxidoreductase complex cytochrome b subunit